MMTQRLTFDEAIWIAFLATIALWAILYGVFTPAAIDASLLESTRWAWLASTAAGALLAIAGVVTRGTSLAYLMEASGLCLAAIGPLAYFLLQLYLILSAGPGAEARIPPLAATVALLLALIARLANIRHQSLPRQGQAISTEGK